MSESSTSNHAPPATERENATVAALRRIMRAVEIHSRKLLDEHGLTAPQLAALQAVQRAGCLSPAAIAERIHLSRGTVTGILARLERRRLLERQPSPSDGRSVDLSLTAEGRGLLERAPSLLQDRFRRQLAALQEWEQLLILSTLQRIASMMDAAELDASPYLVARSEELASDPLPELLPSDAPPDEPTCPSAPSVRDRPDRQG